MSNWTVDGPRALAWFRAEAPHRTTMANIYRDACAALGLPSENGLRLWLARSCPEWPSLKRTLGTATSPVPAGTGGAPSSGAVPLRTLDQYLLDRRKAECPVCHLSPDVRAILKRASEKGSAKVAEQLNWLRDCCGATVTASELTTHRAGGHEL